LKPMSTAVLESRHVDAVLTRFYNPG
jgi:hypothetical protein